MWLRRPWFYANLCGFVMLGTAMGVLVPAAPASAHAAVVSSSPSDGARLDASPAVLSFELNEPVSLVEGSAQLINVDGDRHPFAAEKLEAGRQQIVLHLARPLPDGSYLATARVLSADTHVVSLSIRFSVGNGTQTGQWADADTGQSVVGRSVLYPVKIVVYTGVVLSAGLLLAARWTWTESVGTKRFRLVYRVGSGLLAVGLAARLAILVTEQGGGLLNASTVTVRAVLTTPLGTALVIAAVLSVLTTAYPPNRTHPTLALGCLHAAATIVAVTLGGHGGSTDLWPLPFLATSIHVYCIAVWLGGVVCLGGVVGLGGGPGSALVADSALPLDRWHRVALAHVALAMIAGTLLAVLQVGQVQALVTTPYGVTLIVKIALVGAAVAAGYLAWRRLGTNATSRRIVVIEAGLALLIVAATSMLSSHIPAKDSYTTNVATRMDFGSGDVLDVGIDTIRRGTQVLTVDYVGTGDAQIGVELSSAQANVARLPVELRRTRTVGDELEWTSAGLIVPSPGKWKVTVRFDDGRGPKLASFFYEVL